MQELAQYIDSINAFDSSAQEMAKIRWDKIAKPLNSLGKLEKAVSQMAGIFGKDDFDIDKKKIVLDEPIRTLGTHVIQIKLHKDVTAKMNVKVQEA